MPAPQDWKPLNFDATVTVGNVIAAGVALTAVFSALVWYFGSRFFPSKGEMVGLREHVDEQIAAARTDVETAVRGMENMITKEVKQLNEHGRERHEQTCRDFARLEGMLTSSIADVRQARDTAIDARAVAGNTKETLDKAVDRIERSVESLLNRQRAAS